MVKIRFDKLIVPQLVNKFNICHENRLPFIVFVGACHWVPSSAELFLTKRRTNRTKTVCLRITTKRTRKFMVLRDAGQWLRHLIQVREITYVLPISTVETAHLDLGIRFPVDRCVSALKEAMTNFFRILSNSTFKIFLTLSAIAQLRNSM
jgi:hypothetical protein